MILDTSALLAWAEGLQGVATPLRSAERVIVPSVVLGEYLFGIRQSPHRQEHEEWLARQLPLTEVATITSTTASLYADVRLHLKQRRTAIPSNVVWVAALARQHEEAVLSGDSRFDLVDHVNRISF